VPLHASAMADAMVDLLSDQDLRGRMGDRAAIRAQERFTVDRLVADHESLYTRLVEGRSAG